MVTVKYSQNFKAAQARIKRLPKMYEKSITAHAKKWAVRLVKAFHDGIKGEKYGLLRLQTGTILAKARKRYSQPATPLYALGDDDKKHSYANMMRVKKVKKSWKVVPTKTKLKGSDFTFAQLYVVHEYGVTISNGFGLGIKIRIPPRPAMKAAYEKVMGEWASEDPHAIIQKAIIDLITKNDDRWFAKMVANDPDGDRYEER